MKKFLSSKSLALLLGGTAVLAVVVLAAALPFFQFKPAEALAVPQEPTPGGLTAAPITQSVPLGWILAATALVLIFLVALFLLLDPKQRKRFLLQLLRLGLLAALVLLVLSRWGFVPPPTMNQTPSPFSPGAAQSSGAVAAPEPFRAPLLPSWAVYLITLSLLGGILAGGFWLLNRKRQEASAPPLEELASIARSALGKIQSGKGWEDSIVQCYVRMSQTVSRRRDLSRAAAVTPREFSRALESAGLPGPAVGQLTGLFERVRYGAKPSTPEEIQTAVDCLTVILHACGESL